MPRHVRTASRDCRRRWLAVVCLAVCLARGGSADAQAPPAVAASGVAAPADGRPLVILLHSYDTTFDWSRHVTRGLYAGLDSLRVAADTREEYLDARRHQRREHFPEMRDLLRAKYLATPPRLVVACDNAAVEFLRTHPDVFAGAPVVFGGVDDDDLLARLPRDRYTGLGEKFRLDALIDLALLLRPRTQRVIAITDNSPAGRLHRAQLARAPSTRSGPRLVDLSAARFTVDEIRTFLATETTADDLVLLAPVTRDRTGQPQTARDVIAMVAATSPAPVIGFLFSELGQGVLATTTSTGEMHGRLIADKVRQVLAGTPTRDIPIEMDGTTVLAFDAPQLARWGIARQALPPNAVVYNDPPSVYGAYRRMMWGGAAFIIGQMLVIGGLIVNVQRRRHAEAALAAQASALVASNRQLEETNRSLRLEKQGRAEAEDHLRHAQKMEAVGRLAGGVAHDFNNLLTVILGYASLLLGSTREPAAHEGLEQIRRAGEQAASLTRDLLAFSRKSVAAPVRVDVVAAIRQLEPMLRRFCGDGITLTLDLDDATGEVALGEGQLEQVLLNLVINARDAMLDGGTLRIAARREAGALTEDGDCTSEVVLHVADTGVGMDEETRAHVFEPFFTTKPVGRGTGLGLATVYGIVTQHGGSITVVSAPGVGSDFRVTLPSAGGEIAGAQSDASAATAGRGEVILLVEDERDLRRLAAVVLRGAGYDVVEAADGEAAIHVVGERAGAIDLVLTDVVMPGMDGYTLARRLRDAHPAVRVAFMSGYVEPQVEAQAPGDTALLLRKPFTPAGLLAHVRAALPVSTVAASSPSA